MSILKINGVSKYFGGLAALEQVSFDVPVGTIIGLIGPNGSGKTTLFNCISGIYKLTAGTIEFKGKQIGNMPPHLICHQGIGRTYQNVRPFANLSVYDNVRAGYVFSGRARSNKKQHESVMETIKFVGLAGKEELKAGSLPLAIRKRLEIGRALAGEPDLLLLDEVAAGLNIAESQEIIELVNQINRRGITILMVEHVMPIIMKVCSKIVVLNDGKLISEGAPQEISNDKCVIESYLGTEAMKELAF